MRRMDFRGVHTRSKGRSPFPVYSNQPCRNRERGPSSRNGGGKWSRASKHVRFGKHAQNTFEEVNLVTALARHLDAGLGLPAEVQRIADTRSGAEKVEAMVSLQARSKPSLWAVARAVDAVRRTDPAGERAWQDRLDARLAGCRHIVARLESEGNLRAGLDPSSAADFLWTMTSLRTWEDLVLERGWSPQKYQRHVTRFLLEALTRGTGVRR
jgi:hypothetical protein